jgi:hypothetical protein
MSIQDLVNEVMSRDGRGRKPSTVGAVVSRELTPADIVRLNDAPASVVATPLKKLKHSHHMLAKLIADGVREEEISSISGYTVAYISAIKCDPAFSSLVEYYAEQKKEIYIDVHQRLSTLSLDAVDEIQSRLAETPDGFQNRELFELAAMGLDRTGFGKQSRVDHNHTVALVDPTQIARMKDDMRPRSMVTPLLTAQNSPAPMGEVIDVEPISETTRPEGLEGLGAGLPAQSGEVPPEGTD